MDYSKIKKTVSLPNGRVKFEEDLTDQERETRGEWLASFGKPLDEPKAESVEQYREWVEPEKELPTFEEARERIMNEPFGDNTKIDAIKQLRHYYTSVPKTRKNCESCGNDKNFRACPIDNTTDRNEK